MASKTFDKFELYESSQDAVHIRVCLPLKKEAFYLMRVHVLVAKQIGKNSNVTFLEAHKRGVLEIINFRNKAVSINRRRRG